MVESIPVGIFLLVLGYIFGYRTGHDRGELDQELLYLRKKVFEKELDLEDEHHEKG